MNPTIDAYAAGLLDGEGCVGASSNRGKSIQIRVDIGMTLKAKHVLERMQAQYGGRVRLTRPATDKWDEAWCWLVHGREAAVYLRRVQPYVVLKGEQVRLALAIEEMRDGLPKTPTGRARWDKETLARAQRAYERIKELNRKGPSPRPLPTGAKQPFARLVAGMWVETQQSLFADLGSERFSETLPAWGSMRSGELYERPTPAPLTAARDSSSLPTPRATDGEKGGPNQVDGRGVRDSLPGLVALLPTPEGKLSDSGPDYARASRPDSGGDDLTTTVFRHLLPTPTTQDGANTGGPSQYDRNSLPLNALAPLLPTPNTMDSMEPRSAEALARARQSGGCFNLKDVLTSVPTPPPSDESMDDQLSLNWGGLNGDTTQAGPGEVLPDVRGTTAPEAVRAVADARGHGAVHVAQDLWPGVRVHEADSDEGWAALAGTEAPEGRVPGVRDEGTIARPPRRPRPREQRPGEPDDAVLVMPPETALAGGQGQASGVDDQTTTASVRDLRGDVPSSQGEDADMLTRVQSGGAELADERACAAVWGQYAPAILRWQMVLGRVAPPPTEPGKDGRPRLSPRAVEWLMGLPDGWVTDPALGIPRAAQLKALGNGIVPQQMALALRLLLGVAS